VAKEVDGVAGNFIQPRIARLDGFDGLEKLTIGGVKPRMGWIGR